jgi:Flp pilus assembly protein TadG
MFSEINAFSRPPRFARAESGAVSVEFVLWLPIFFVVLMLIVDAAFLFGGQAYMMRIAQDTNRSISVGVITTMEGARTRVLSELAPLTPSAGVDTQSSVTGDVITTTISVPMRNLVIGGPLSLLTDDIKISVRATHKDERT